MASRYLILSFLIFLSNSLLSQSYYFPPVVGDTWETTSPESLGWCTEEIDPLYNYLEEINSKAFIVLKDGKIVLEKYFDSFTQDSVWYWASAGKTMTSFMVGLAQEQGHLDIHNPSSDYLGAGWTSLTPVQEEAITVWHQLTMTSGLDDGVADPFCTLPSCLEYLAEPGTRWAYHNGPYTMLDGVIENATGTTLNLYVTQQLKNKTGITGLFIPNGYNRVFYSTPRNMARFGSLIFNKGNWDGEQIMTDTMYFNEMVNTSQNLNKSYGYLWWLNGKESYLLPGPQFEIPGSMAPSAPDDMISALGKNGQILNVVPGEGLVCVRMGNDPNAGLVSAFIVDTIWQHLNEVICTSTSVEDNLMEEMEVYPNPVSNALNVRWEGQEFDLTIFNASGTQVLQLNGQMQNSTISMAGLPKGLYFVRVLSEKGNVQTRRIVLAGE